MYCIFNTERSIVIKRAFGTSTFDSLEEAQDWLDTKDNPNHLTIKELIDP